MTVSDTASASTSVESFSFESVPYPPGERFARYRSLYSEGSDAVEIGPKFFADVRGWRMDHAILYRRVLNDVEHRRDLVRVVDNAFDHFTLTVVYAGCFEVDSGNGFRITAPGHGMLLDMSRPMANRAYGAHVVTISIARKRLMQLAGNVTGLHGFCLEKDRLALLSSYLSSLTNHMETVTPDMVPAATRAVESLLAAALVGRPQEHTEPVHSDGEARLDRVRAVIETMLVEPGITPAMVAEKSGVSRATLYRMFTVHGGIAYYIQQRRLDLLRALLANPDDTRSLSELSSAVGFFSESHSSRVFLERFGIRPKAYRAAFFDGDPILTRAVHDYWTDELNP